MALASRWPGTAIPVTIGLAAAAAAAPSRLVVLTSEDGAGSVSTMELAAPWTPSTGLAGVGARAVVRHHDDALWVVNGAPGNDVQRIDPDTWATVLRIPTGAGSDPEDIVFAGGAKAYVSLAGAAFVLVVDTAAGAVTGAVDLSAFADADGVPDLGRMEVHDGRAFVQVRRRSHEGGSVTPVPPSLIAVIDVVTDTLVDADPQAPGTQAVVLTGLDPVGDMQIDGGFLHVIEQGAYEAIDEHGGVDRIDLATLAAAGFVTTEGQLGGHADCFVLASPTTGYAVTHTDWTLSSHLTRFSRADGSSEGTVLEIVGTHTRELALDAETGLLYFPVSAADPGVRVFDTATDTALTTGSRPTGPAVDLLVVHGGGATSAPSAFAPPALVVGPSQPNPFRFTTHLPVSLDRAGRVTLVVYDASGRRIAERSDDLPVGRHRVAWDGRDAHGAAATAGVYFLRVDCGSERQTRRALLIR